MPGENSGCPGGISGFGDETYGWELFQPGGTWMFSCELFINDDSVKCCINLNVLIALSSYCNKE